LKAKTIVPQFTARPGIATGTAAISAVARRQNLPPRRPDKMPSKEIEQTAARPA
jgi:hypothetical protein